MDRRTDLGLAVPQPFSGRVAWFRGESAAGSDGLQAAPTESWSNARSKVKSSCDTSRPPRGESSPHCNDSRSVRCACRSPLWLDGFIERKRSAFKAGGIGQGLANSFGAFLGECIIIAYGGAWAWHEQAQDWCIHLGPGLPYAFPLVKTYKHLQNGPEDSILSFFDVTGEIVAKGGD
jgi:hypothetical protein